MVNRKISTLVAVCLLLFHFQMAYAEKRQRIKARTIASIVISEAGKSDDDNELENKYCKSFRPTKSDVRLFFLKSYSVPAKMGAHDRYSPCFAKGSIEFSDNTRGKWKISSSGNGTLFWDTGDIDHLFHRDYKWNDPFSCTYGLSSEGEC